jgi:hypothetical protein
MIRAVEFVALPGTAFRIIDSQKSGGTEIYRVTTDDYPYPSKSGYFIDGRFVKLSDSTPPPRRKVLPTREQVIRNLLAAEGSRYVWGGNHREGIPQLLVFYPPAQGPALPAATLGMWQLAGVDCSGLLYEATNGFTPRNTSSLVEYGSPLAIAGLKVDRIINKLEPLDLVVWSGHAMIVLDRERIIESRLDPKVGEGVVVRPLRRALVELLKLRFPLDDFSAAKSGKKKGFVIRRWYPEGG